MISGMIIETMQYQLLWLGNEVQRQKIMLSVCCQYLEILVYLLSNTVSCLSLCKETQGRSKHIVRSNPKPVGLKQNVAQFCHLMLILSIYMGFKVSRALHIHYIFLKKHNRPVKQTRNHSQVSVEVRLIESDFAEAKWDFLAS